MEKSSRASSPLIVSYLTLRKIIGLLGISFPFILLLGTLLFFQTGIIEKSISYYYHTGMGDFFVGTLFVIGAFLLSYKGYEIKDDIAGDLGCLFIIGVALFPTASLLNPSAIDKIIGIAHWVFASLFFLTVAYFSLFLFTKTNPKKPPTLEKLWRNKIYRLCGYLILVSIALILIIQIILPSNIEQALSEWKPVFWLESIATFAFGFSWLTKGEAILSDHKRN